MADQMKNVMIGVFVVAALCILIFVILFLHPYVGDQGKILHARFTNIDKVNVGTRVTYAGRPVGEVTEIREVEFGRNGPTDPSGRVYLYELSLRVDSSVNVYNSDEISLRTSGLLGERNVEITPYAPKEGQILKQIDNQIVFATPSESVEDTLKELKGVGTKIESAIEHVSKLVSRANDKKIVDKIARIADNFVDITDSLNKPKKIESMITNFHDFSTSLNSSWSKSIDPALIDFKEASANLRIISNDSKDIFARVCLGEGTIGRLLAKDDLYLQLNSLLAKAETIFDDINHYGLLFQTDKGWQRLRARRLNLLQTLCSPQEFRNYFNDEIDQISTSLSRVGMVLEQSGCDPCSCDMMLDCEFTKVFAELLRRVKTIEEELRMYNIQVVEAHVHETELNPP